jgi:hypothetical protein
MLIGIIWFSVIVYEMSYLIDIVLKVLKDSLDPACSEDFANMQKIFGLENN